MKIAELRDGMSNIDITAQVKEVAEPREVVTRYGTPTTVTEATLEDDTGTVILTLWGEQSKGMVPGATVSIVNGYTRSWRDKLQLGVPKSGKLEVNQGEGEEEAKTE